jgi:Asp-tRNA(Asn)/Glu-tRNA(Gln) amidotransferase A subunit family amidase
MSNASSFLSARETARLIAAENLTAVEAANVCFETIAGREPVVGAWQTIDKEQVLAQAKAYDREASLSGKPLPLGGVPIAVKDNLDTSDLPTSYGSSIYESHQPVTDAACVALARRAGAIVMGKTVTTEFAYYRPGKTSNPHNSAHTPGGSSQGSAAAVASGMVPLAFGTQTAGSVIRPASYCGIVGFKPSWGLIARQGAKILSDWLDTVGVFGRDVEDVAFFVAGLTGRNALRPDGSGGPFEVAVLRPPYPAEPEPETVATLERAAEALRKAGHGVSDLPTPHSLQNLPRLQRLVMAYDMEKALAFERRVYESSLSSILKSYLDEGKGISPRAYDSAMAATRDVQRDIDSVFGSADVILAPSAPGEAPKGLHATGDPAFNRIWTQLQLPCINVPAGSGPNGLPVGTQLIARYGQDALLLAAALALEQALAAV